jgi:hypothetical protein
MSVYSWLLSAAKQTFCKYAMTDRKGRKALSQFRELNGSTTPDSRPSLLRNLNGGSGSLQPARFQPC